MGANGAPSWSIMQVKDVEDGAEAEITCPANGVEDTFSTLSRTHVTEQINRRLPVSESGTKQRRYSSANEKMTNLKHLSPSTHDTSGSCSSGRTQSASSDSDLEKRRMLRKFKDATVEMRTETKRFISTMKHKLLNRRGSKVTPIKQIHILPESDSMRWASRPATASSTFNTRTRNSIHSYSTTNLHVLHDVDHQNVTLNRSDAACM